MPVEGPRPTAAAQPQVLGATARRILLDDVIPFWEGCVDWALGGYRLNHDAAGRWRGPAEKFLVTQARMLWFFARLARRGLEFREGAEAGYRFLRECMWDPRHGGFYWAVSNDGTHPTRPGKHLYGQAFALFALCEYARATSDPDVQELCDSTFHLIEVHAYDRHNLGYRESFTVGWEPTPQSELGYLDVPADRKLFNTHLHLLEAVTSLVKLSGEDLSRQRLRELIAICSECVIEERTGGCRDEFSADWRSASGHAGQRCSYGHDLENVALLQRAVAALGLADEHLLSRCRRICLHALTHGFDAERGGFFASGPLGRPADRREKIYWVQAEALFGLLRMWQATGERTYLDCLSQTLGWIEAVQVDRAGGDWHSVIGTNGAASGDKAGQWKDPYHQTRALLAVSELSPATLVPTTRD
jgi:cellobiose epimerase